jgi:fatty acid desaturase
MSSHRSQSAIAAQRNFIFKLAIFSALIGVSTLLAIQSHLTAKIAGTVLLGILFAHAVELQHQCLHGSAFLSRKTNRSIGILLGVPSLVSFTHYQFLHLAHHKNLGTKNDAEFFDNPYLKIRSVKRKSKLLLLAWSIFNFPRFGRLVRDVQRAAAGKTIVKNAPEEINKKIISEYLLLAAFLALGLLLAIFTNQWVLFTSWAIALVFVAEPAHSLIELPEHADCDRNTSDPLKNTRTIEGSWFSFWLTNGNNFHVEHHKYPSLPINELPEVFNRLRGSHEFITFSYFDFFKTFSGDPKQLRGNKILPLARHQGEFHELS